MAAAGDHTHTHGEDGARALVIPKKYAFGCSFPKSCSKNSKPSFIMIVCLYAHQYLFIIQKHKYAVSVLTHANIVSFTQKPK